MLQRPNNRPTIGERLYPVITRSGIVTTWNDHLINQLLESLWQAYDALYTNALSHVDMSQPSDDLERELTKLICLELQRSFNTDLPVQPMHAYPEHESRAPAPAKPPEYDIAFVLYANPRMCWPVEAKVLDSDRNTTTNLGDYVNTFNDRFMTCYYAPFSPNAAMLGYQRSGNSTAIFGHIAGRLGCSLTPYSPLSNRAHRTSQHQRIPHSGKPYPSDFVCHHLMMPLT